MWIGEVDFPSELIDAHVAGQLVIFVGAGASLASPSNLPDFGRLTRDVMSSSMRVLSKDQELLPLESKLGILEHDGIDVNALVALQIGSPLSRPNALHDAIIRLACSAPTLRIVTTNYDRHLSTAIAKIRPSIGEFAAPCASGRIRFRGPRLPPRACRRGPETLGRHRQSVWSRLLD